MQQCLPYTAEVWACRLQGLDKCLQVVYTHNGYLQVHTSVLYLKYAIS